MKKFLARLILVFVLVLSVNQAFGFEYFLYLTNHPPNESRNHSQTFMFDGTLLVEIPSNFSFISATGNFTANATSVFWNSSQNVSLVLESPQNCTEGDITESGLFVNGSLFDEFRYICLPDNKIVDYKAEYGHGDANYLSDLYISNETITLFNLIRVWNLGGYLSPNEDAENVSIMCEFEDYPLRTFGRTEVEASNNGINSTFSWSEIGGGYWFRIGVLSQDISGLPVGETYNVSCSNLVYDFSHQRVNASFGQYSIEIRDTQPFNVTCLNITGDNSHHAVQITNVEEYPAFDIFFDRNLDGFQSTERLLQLDPGETVQYKIDQEAYNTTIHFIPSWFRNSRNQIYYEQDVSCNVSGSINISNDVNVSDIGNISVNISLWNPLISGRPTGINISVYYTDNGSGVNNASIDITEQNGYTAFALPQRIDSNVTSLATARTTTDADGFVMLTITPTGGSGLIGSESYVGDYLLYVDVTVDGTLVNRTFLNNTQRILQDATGVVQTGLPSRTDIITFHNFLAVVYDKINDWLI